MAKKATKDQFYTRIYITGEINEQSLQQFNRDLDSALAKGASAAMVYITSVGGDYHCALALYNRIKASPLHLIGVGTGMVASSALVVLAAFQTRLAMPRTWWLLHSLSTELSGHTRRIGEELKQMEREHLEYAELLAEVTNWGVDDILSNMDGEHYFDTLEAYRIGLVQEILTEEK